MTGQRELLAAVVVALLLTGCSVVSVPSPGLDAAEADEMHQRLLDLRWHWTRLPDEQRPPNPEVQSVSQSDWAEFLAGCMNDAGYDNYSAQGDALAITDVTRTAEQMDAVAVAYYLCESSMTFAEYPEVAYNQKQLDYIYEYYKKFLIPCLEVHNVTIYGIPTRAEFNASLGGWSPYYATARESQLRFDEHSTIFRDCPSTAPGMPDDGMASAYGS